MIYNDVDQKLVTNEGVCTCRSNGAFLFDVIVNHAHRDVFAYTKRKLSIASVTPELFWALDPSKAAPLSCVVLAPMLHGGPAWVSQNVELFSLSAPAKEGILHSECTSDPTDRALVYRFINDADGPASCSSDPSGQTTQTLQKN